MRWQAANNLFSALSAPARRSFSAGGSLRFHCLSEGLYALPKQSRRPSATLSRSTLHTSVAPFPRSVLWVLCGRYVRPERKPGNPMTRKPDGRSQLTASQKTARPQSPTTPPGIPCPKPSSGSKTPAGPPSPRHRPLPACPTARNPCAPLSTLNPQPSSPLIACRAPGNLGFPLVPRPLALRLSHPRAMRPKPSLRGRPHQEPPRRKTRLDP